MVQEIAANHRAIARKPAAPGYAELFHQANE
jgi:hypothetical protein